MYNGGDGTHLSPAGVQAAAPSVRELIVQTGADLVVSDSTLCCVDGNWRDKSGSVAALAIGATPVRPWWGASFLHDSKSFAEGIRWAREDCGGGSTILVLVAGNDLGPRVAPRSLDFEMRRIRAEWAQRGVRVLYIDVIPQSHQWN